MNMKVDFTQSVRWEDQKQHLQYVLGFLERPDPPEHGHQEHCYAAQQTGEYEAGQHYYLTHGGFPEPLLQQVDEAVTSRAVKQHQQHRGSEVVIGGKTSDLESEDDESGESEEHEVQENVPDKDRCPVSEGTNFVGSLN